MQRDLSALQATALAAALPAALLLCGNNSVDASIDQSLSRFVAACTRGEGRFPRGSIAQVSYRDLPVAVQRHFGRVEEGAFYRLADKAGSVLMNFHPRQIHGDEYKQICAIVVPQVRFDHILETVAPKLGMPLPPAEHRRGDRLEYFNSKDEYQIVVRDIQPRFRHSAGGSFKLSNAMILVQISPLRKDQAPVPIEARRSRGR